MEADARPRPRGARPRRPDPARRSPAARSGCCSVCRPSTRCATGRASRRSTACRSTRRWRASAILRCAPRSWPSRPQRRRRHGVHRARARPDLPARRPARLRARARREHRRASPSARAATRATSTTTCCSRDDGRELLLRPLLGYSRFTHDPIREMVEQPDDRARPRRRRRALRRDLRRQHRDVHAHALGARPQPRASGCRSSCVVRKMTSDTAALYGLGDRGEITPGAVPTGGRQRRVPARLVRRLARRVAAVAARLGGPGVRPRGPQPVLLGRAAPRDHVHAAVRVAFPGGPLHEGEPRGAPPPRPPARPARPDGRRCRRAPRSTPCCSSPAATT